MMRHHRRKSIKKKPPRVNARAAHPQAGGARNPRAEDGAIRRSRTGGDQGREGNPRSEKREPPRVARGRRGMGGGAARSARGRPRKNQWIIAPGMWTRDEASEAARAAKPASEASGNRERSERACAPWAAMGSVMGARKRARAVGHGRAIPARTRGRSSVYKGIADVFAWAMRWNRTAVLLYRRFRRSISEDLIEDPAMFALDRINIHLTMQVSAIRAPLPNSVADLIA